MTTQAELHPTLKAAFEKDPGAAPAPPIAVDQLQVFVAAQGKVAPPLPQGLSVTWNPLANLLIDKTFPSPEQPNRLLGKLSLYVPESAPPDAYLKKLAEAAAGNGANALIVVAPSQAPGEQLVQGYALRLTGAIPMQKFPPMDELRKELSSNSVLSSYTAAGAPVFTKLDSKELVAFDGKRGTCYAISFVLDSSAVFSGPAFRYLAWKSENAGTELNSVKEIGKNIPAMLRSHAVELGCPYSAGPIRVNLSVGENVPSEPGHGAVELQVYSRPADMKQLAREEKAFRVAFAKAEAERTVKFKAGCTTCRPRLDECRQGHADLDWHQCDAYTKCLEPFSYGAGKCPSVD